MQTALDQTTNQKIYFPFADARWRMKMGLQPLRLEDWIEIDDRFTAYLSQKADVLQRCYPTVFACLPGSESAQTEVLQLLLDHLLEQFPQIYQRHEQQIVNLLTQQSWTITDFTTTPLDLAGRLVQEDLCLMQPSAQGYVLVAGSVCFPFHWRLPDKLGQPIARIHQAVPLYAEKLEHPVNTFFDRLKVEHPGYRLTWGMVDSPALFRGHRDTNQAPVTADITIDNAGHTLWIRVERQTFRRLPISQHILFTVRTYIYPLSMLEHDPQAAAAMLNVIQQMPFVMQQYKNFPAIETALTGYLHNVNTTRCGAS